MLPLAPFRPGSALLLGAAAALFAAVTCPAAQAAVLQPGVYLLSQDIGFGGADTDSLNAPSERLLAMYGDETPTATYFGGATTLRAGLNAGIMADARLDYQWYRLGEEPPTGGRLRGGLQSLRLGLLKQIAAVSPNEKASFFPSSSLGDIETFAGATLPLRTSGRTDFLSPFEGVLKLDLGLRHTYYGSVVNFETTLSATYRRDLPTQGFAQIVAPIHWESCPIPDLRYSLLKPSLSYLHSFGGSASPSAADFLDDWSDPAAPPAWNVRSRVLTAGIELMQPFSYTFYTSIHYSRPVYSESAARPSEFGIKLNHLF